MLNTNTSYQANIKNSVLKNKITKLRESYNYHININFLKIKFKFLTQMVRDRVDFRIKARFFTPMRSVLHEILLKPIQT